MVRSDRRATLSDSRISYFLRDAHALLLDAASLKAGTRTLVLQCRDGWTAEEAWRRVVRGQVIGVDHSDEMIEAARRYREVPGKLEFSVWDRQSLPFPGGSFDTAISTFTLHRFRDPGQLLKEARRVLVPGGTLMLLEPNKYSYFGAFSLVDLFSRWTDATHVRYYSRRELGELLLLAGFKEPKTVAEYRRFLSGGKLFANGMILMTSSAAAAHHASVGG